MGEEAITAALDRALSSVAVPARELGQTQPVAMRVEPHRLGVDRDRIPEAEIFRDVTVMQVMGHWMLRTNRTGECGCFTLAEPARDFNLCCRAEA